MNEGYYNLILCFPPLILLLITAVLSRRNQPSWLSPNAFISGIWAVLSLFAFIATSDFNSSTTPISPIALWALFLYNSLFSLSYQFSSNLLPKVEKRSKEFPLKKNQHNAKKKGGMNKFFSDLLSPNTIIVDLIDSSKKEKQLKLNSHYLVQFLIFVSAIAFLNDIFIIQHYGTTISSLFSLSNLAALSNSASVDRYSGEKFPQVIRILTTSYYLLSLLGGQLYAVSGKNLSQKILSLLSFLPCLIYTLITTSKANLAFSLIFWFGSFLAWTTCSKPTKIRVFTPVSLLLILMIVFTFYFGTILTALLRVGNLDSNLDISSKTTNYFIGFLPAFSEWIEEFIVNYGKEDLTLGAYTFAGIYELLGFGVRQQGLIQEFVSYGDSVGGTTNIYTVFRFLIMDYGLFGSLFLTLSLGFTMPLIYFHASTGHRFSIVLLAIFYASSLWSHTASIFVYNTIVLSLIIYAIYVLAFSRKQIKKTELMV